jgi:hypothetical protein
MVPRPMSWPRFDNAPRMRVDPQLAFSRSICATSFLISSMTRGLPGPRLLLPSYLRAISVGCHASSVSGVTKVSRPRSAFPAQHLGLGREAPTLIISEPDPLALHLLSEYPVLFQYVLVHFHLLAGEPAGQSEYDDLPWVKN